MGSGGRSSIPRSSRLHGSMEIDAGPTGWGKPEGARSTRAPVLNRGVYRWHCISRQCLFMTRQGNRSSGYRNQPLISDDLKRAEEECDKARVIWRSPEGSRIQGAGSGPVPGRDSLPLVRELPNLVTTAGERSRRRIHPRGDRSPGGEHQRGADRGCELVAAKCEVRLESRILLPGPAGSITSIPWHLFEHSREFSCNSWQFGPDIYRPKTGRDVASRRKNDFWDDSNGSRALPS